MADHFTISVGDEAVVPVEDIWPDGDAPENPTVDDVIEKIKKGGKYQFMSEWGFDTHVEVNGRNVGW